MNRFISFTILIFILFPFFSACGPDAVLLRGHLNSPEVHTDNGRKLFNVGKLSAAMREFQMALELAPDYSPAYAGIAKIHIYKGDFLNSMRAVKNAQIYAKTDEESLAAEIGCLRLYAYGVGNFTAQWLSMAETVFKKAVKRWKNEPALYYYMGLAYKKAKRYKTAEQYFLKVIDLDDKYMREADHAYADMLKEMRGRTR